MVLGKNSQSSKPHPRRSVLWRALVKVKKKNFFTPCIVLNISKEGALIRSIEHFKIGFVYPIMINAMINQSKHKIYIMAEICHITLSQRYYRIGISFTKITPEDQDILNGFINDTY